MYALVEIKGKQYKAVEGATLTVDKLENESGDSLEFESVLLMSNDGDVKVGTPYVKGAKVTAELEEHGKAGKIIVTKFRRDIDRSFRRSR